MPGYDDPFAELLTSDVGAASDPFASLGKRRRSRGESPDLAALQTPADVDRYIKFGPPDTSAPTAPPVPDSYADYERGARHELGFDREDAMALPGMQRTDNLLRRTFGAQPEAVAGADYFAGKLTDSPMMGEAQAGPEGLAAALGEGAAQFGPGGHPWEAVKGFVGGAAQGAARSFTSGVDVLASLAGLRAAKMALALPEGAAAVADTSPVWNRIAQAANIGMAGRGGAHVGQGVSEGLTTQEGAINALSGLSEAAMGSLGVLAHPQGPAPAALDPGVWRGTNPTPGGPPITEAPWRPTPDEVLRASRPPDINAQFWPDPAGELPPGPDPLRQLTDGSQPAPPPAAPPQSQQPASAAPSDPLAQFLKPNELAELRKQGFPDSTIYQMFGLDVPPEVAARSTIPGKVTQPAPKLEVLDQGGPNASGESAASQEAISREAGMKARGQTFAVVDRAGKVRPLVGPEAVDYNPAPGETYGIQNADGTFRTLTDNGGRPPKTVAAAPAAAPAAEPDPFASSLGMDSSRAEAPAPSNALEDMLGMVKRGQSDTGTGFFDDPHLDPVSGLQNRAGFDRRVPKGGEGRIVMRGDLDNFKRINDTMGHAEGDRALQVVGDTLKQTLRAGDVGARKGGDEFALDIAAGSDPQIARDRIESAVNDALEKAGFKGTGLSLGYGADEGAADAAAIARKKERGVSVPRRAVQSTEVARATPEQVQPGNTYQMSPHDIEFDPTRLQYKQDVNEHGVQQPLGKYRPELGGKLLVWRDPESGAVKVVNGHHRLDAAQRDNAESVTVHAINAPDAQSARAIGALANIAEDKGTPLDAAKFLRDTNMTTDQLAEAGFSLRSKVADDGQALATLSDENFNAAVNGDMPMTRAVAIGKLDLSPEEQASLNRLVQGMEARGRRVDAGMIRELGEEAKAAPTVDVSEGEQPDMFAALLGDRKLRNLAFERAALRDAVRTQLLADKRRFSAVARAGEAVEHERAGNVINVQGSQQLADQARTIEGVFSQLANVKGPVSDALTDAATRIAQGEKPASVKAALYDRIAEAVSREIDAGGARDSGDEAARPVWIDRPAGGTGEPGEPGQPARGTTGAQTLDELLRPTPEKGLMSQQRAYDAAQELSRISDEELQARADMLEKSGDSPALRDVVTEMSRRGMGAEPVVDQIEAGAQPRLPGDVGDVREQEIPTPAEELPPQTEQKPELLAKGTSNEPSMFAEADNDLLAQGDEPQQEIVPRHEVRDPEKVAQLAEDMRQNGWQGRPALVVNDKGTLRGWTSTHRIAAAQEAGIEVPTHEVPGEDLEANGHDVEALTAKGKKARIAALEEAGHEDAADLLRGEVAQNEADQPVEDKPYNLIDYLQKRLGYPRGAIDAMSLDEAQRIGKAQEDNPNRPPPAEAKPELGEDELYNLLTGKTKAERATAIAKRGTEQTIEARRNLARVGEQENPRGPVPETRLAKILNDRLDLKEGGGVKSPAELNALRGRNVQRAREMERALDAGKYEKFGNLLDEANDDYWRSQLKGGTGKERPPRVNERSGQVLGSGLGALQDVIDDPKKYARIASELWKVPGVREFVGAAIGATIDDKDRFSGALYGAILAGSTRGGAKTLGRLYANFKAGRKIFTPRDIADRDISWWRLAYAPSPERTVPDLFKDFHDVLADVHDVWSKALPPEEAAKARAAIDQISRKDMAAMAREYAQEARAKGQMRKAWYAEALGRRISRTPTGGQVNEIRAGLKPGTIEKHLRANIYRVGIGYNVSSFLQNTSQPILALLHMSPVSLARGYRAAFTEAGRLLAEQGRDIKLGRLMDQPTDLLSEIQGKAPQDSILRDSGRLLRGGDNFNRRAVMLGALEEKGLLKAALAAGELPDHPDVRWAESVVRKTQGGTGPLGNNPFHKGPISGTSSVFQKYPGLWLENYIGALEDPDTRAKTAVVTMLGLMAMSKVSGIDVWDMFASGGRPLGLDFTKPWEMINAPGRTVKRIAHATPPGRIVSDVWDHITGQAHHPFIALPGQKDFLEADTTSLVASGYPVKVAKVISHIGAEGMGPHTPKPYETVGHSGFDDLASLLGLQTTEHKARMDAMHEAKDFKAEDMAQRKQNASDLRDQYDQAVKDGDTYEQWRIQRQMTPQQRRNMQRRKGQTGYEHERESVPRDRRKEFDEKFKDRYAQ